jgi:hypothetical protein
MAQVLRKQDDFTRWKGFAFYREGSVSDLTRKELQFLSALVTDGIPPNGSGGTEKVVVGSFAHGSNHGANMPGKVTPRESQTCDSVQTRLSTALVQRLYPNTTLHIKQIPVADPESLQRWVKGEGAPSAENLSALIRFFWAAGDRAFLFEVLGIEPLPLLARDIASEVEAVLRRKGMAA